MITRQFIVTGIVQGVGFRWFVRQAAADLGLAGYARNCPDGSVEVVARGQPSALASLHERLATGPELSRVDAVEVSDRVDDPAIIRFEIRRG